MFIFDSYGTIKNQVIVWTIHELVDFITIFLMLLIMRISIKYQLLNGESIIDIGNLNFREEIAIARNAIVFKCDLKQNYNDNTQEDFNEKYVMSDTEIPVIIINPTDENEKV